MDPPRVPARNERLASDSEVKSRASGRVRTFGRGVPDFLAETSYRMVACLLGSRKTMCFAISRHPPANAIWEAIPDPRTRVRTAATPDFSLPEAARLSPEADSHISAPRWPRLLDLLLEYIGLYAPRMQMERPQNAESSQAVFGACKKCPLRRSRATVAAAYRLEAPVENTTNILTIKDVAQIL